ncbi:endonuclease/exonuclease/phosphatase family protein [Chitinophaga sp. sic0106]|uniref:endonuclease/exonuclease/phosphatase family protein n=1 Tax=Chitinophaga sp. sic0106 TaxID=2854785 RepID=UPI001C44ECBE|nr:endonuclease/exonuclease/phosphatase family protein [Chitinophaga sp. sic0106]MBV7529751.1 endonuclease/exonuclease/phosphatase family protein [Chitinophaga sp. sic0106]
MKKLITVVLLLTTISLKNVYAQQPLKVLSYNILEGMVTDTTKGKQVFVNWIKELDPDILALQECNGFTQQSLEALAATWGHPYAVIVKENGYPTGLTSKYPIAGIRKINENMTHGFIMAKIKDYNIVVLHLNPHRYKKRRQEIAAIMDNIALEANKRNWILMGDFNSNTPQEQYRLDTVHILERNLAAVKKNPLIENMVNGRFIDYNTQQQVLDAGFIDAPFEYARAEKSRGGTDTIRSNSRIDYIYLSKNLEKKILRCHFIYDDFTAKYSDHRPIYLEIKK